MIEAQGSRLARPSCSICGSDRAASKSWRIPDRYYDLPGLFEVRRCADCRSTWVADPPEDVSPWYPTEYYSYRSDTPLCQRASLKAKLRSAVMAARARESERSDVLRRICPVLFDPDAYLAHARAGQGASILDVGCGAGSALDRYKAAGWRTFGVEIDGRAVAIARAKGHDVVEGDASSWQSQDGAYDIVRATHSIEHVLKPTVLLARLATSVAPEGSLYIDIPNLGSLPARLAGRAFWQLDPPRHLAIPHPKALQQSLDELGLTTEASWTYSFGGSLAHSLWYATTWRGGRVGWRLSDPRPAALRVTSAVLVPVAALLDLLGLGDSIRVVARRQP
jgi:SAM-dependent methyltransferase